MKRVSLIFPILFLSFSKPNIKPPKENVYTVKGTLQEFVYSHNFLDRVKITLTKTSNLSSSQVSAICDTISILQNFTMNQLETQYANFQKQDSITNALKKK